MSIFIYAGSMQYVAIDLLASGASLISTAIMTLMIQVRHLFYGLSIIDKYKDTGKKKLLLIHELTDETYSLLCSVKTPEGIDAGDMRFWIAMLDHSYWILDGVLGALIGGITVGVMAAKHKTVRRQPAANSYVVQDSLHLTQQSDLFLYANTTRTARPKDNARSGSDAHSGSGGSSFGGGGGKF